MMENRTVADGLITLSFMRNARCHRHAAGKNMIPYNNTAPMNHPIRIPRIVSISVAAEMRRKTKYKATKVTTTHIHFHLLEIHLRLGSPEAAGSAGKAVERMSPTKVPARRWNHNQQFSLCAERLL